MNARSRVLWLSAWILFAAGALVSSASAEPRHDVAHRPAWVLDGRFHHERYYPAIGTVVPVLPIGYRPYLWHGKPLFFVDGVWYAPAPGGYVVTHPPIGMIVTLLPPFATPVWVGDVPYYYANDIYYRYLPADNAYEVVDPPEGAVASAPAPAPAASSVDLFVYPKVGQSPQQQSADRYECHKWASGQTGFDPSVNSGADPAKAAQYRKAMTACLEARNYSVA